MPDLESIKQYCSRSVGDEPGSGLLGFGFRLGCQKFLLEGGQLLRAQMIAKNLPQLSELGTAHPPGQIATQYRADGDVFIKGAGHRSDRLIRGRQPAPPGKFIKPADEIPGLLTAGFLTRVLQLNPQGHGIAGRLNDLPAIRQLCQGLSSPGAHRGFVFGIYKRLIRTIQLSPHILLTNSYRESPWLPLRLCSRLAQSIKVNFSFSRRYASVSYNQNKNQPPGRKTSG